MRIILTGSSGYLGRHLIKRLLSRNDDLLCILRRQSDFIDSMKDKLSFAYIDDNDLVETFEKFNANAVFHLACSYEVAGNNESDILNSNFLLPLGLLFKLKVSKHLFISTSLPKYLNAYTLSKNHLSEWGKYYSDKYGFDFYTILLENFYGEDEPQNRFIPCVIKKLKNNEDIDLTEGTQRRDFIYVKDAINGLVKILDCNLKGYHDIPLGSGDWVSIKELIEYLKTVTNSKSILNFGALEKRKNEPESIADLALMHSIGFEVEYDWKLGMKKIVLGGYV